MHGVRTSAPRASDSGRLHGAPLPVRRIRGPGAQNRQVGLLGFRPTLAGWEDFVRSMEEISFDVDWEDFLRSTTEIT